MGPPAAESLAAPGRMARKLVAVMAVATGLSVASNYYAQPLLPAIGKTLHLGPGDAGLVVTAAQVGYAAGLLFIVPLGDLLERRGLVSMLSVGTGLALFWFAASPTAGSLFAAAVVVGALSVVAQVLVPFAASLASAEERGAVVGSVMSGLLIGILLARTVSGWLAEAGTWRAAYWFAGGAMLVQAAVLRWRLPEWRERHGLSYRQILASVAALYREEPVLRLRCIYGAASFGAFSVLWTSIALLLASHYHYSSGIIGLFGLAGAAGALTATLAGRLSDRGRARTSTGVTAVLLLVSWAALWAGKHDLGLLLVGIVVLDIGSQGIHITNQGEIYRLRPEARSRITSAYMFIYFCGGAAGSVLSATLWGAVGWDGVCAAGAAFAAVAVGLWALMGLRPPKVFVPACQNAER